MVALFYRDSDIGKHLSPEKLTTKCIESFDGKLSMIDDNKEYVLLLKSNSYVYS